MYFAGQSYHKNNSLSSPYKKLKLHTKLSPETVHNTPKKFHTKIGLRSFVDYLHPHKYFYN